MRRRERDLKLPQDAIPPTASVEAPLEQLLARPAPIASAAMLRLGTVIGGAVLSLVNVLIVSRALGAVGRGDVVFFATVSTLTAHVSLFGVQEANANVAATDRDSRPALAANSLLLSLLFGAGGAGTVAVLTLLFPAVGGHLPADLRWLALGSVPVLILQIYLQALMQADYAFAVTNIAAMLAPVINVSVNGTLAGLGVITVTTAVVTWFVGQAVATVLLAWYVARRLAGFGRPDVRLAQTSLRFGLKSHPGRIMLLGNFRLDQWFVGAISGARELGLYSVAAVWSEVLFYLPTALAFVQRPDLVRADSRGAARQAATAFRITVLISLPISVVMIVAAPFLCVTIFGDQFGGSVSQLRVLVPGGFGIAALELLGYALTAQKKPTLQTAAIAVGFLSSVALDLILIPPHGGLGAAIASTVSYLAAGVTVAVIFVRSLHGRPGDLIPRPNDVPWLWRQFRSLVRGAA
ncbi:MAG: oligosaccharide flippase family protein [Gaiellaceae bacterium]